MSDLASFCAWLTDEGLSEGTVRVYAADVGLAQRRGGILARIRDGKLAPKTRRRILAAGRRYATWTEDDGLFRELGRLGRRLPPAHRRLVKVPLSPPEWRALLSAIDTEPIAGPVRAHLGLMARRGLRCGDVARLTKAEVDRALRTGVLGYAAKGGRRLEYGVLPAFEPYLRELSAHKGWRKVAELVAPGAAPETAERMAKQRTARTLKRCAAAAGVDDVYPHRLRRTYATEYLKLLGADPEALVKLKQHMQWESLATALGYVDHARGAELDDVARRMFG